jgi:hypothetical protein
MLKGLQYHQKASAGLLGILEPSYSTAYHSTHMPSPLSNCRYSENLIDEWTLISVKVDYRLCYRATEDKMSADRLADF